MLLFQYQNYSFHYNAYVEINNNFFLQHHPVQDILFEFVSIQELILQHLILLHDMYKLIPYLYH